MIILPILALSDNYIWVIKSKNNHVWVVDPGEAHPVNVFLEKEKLQLSGILITHHHWDHTNGASALKTKWQVPVYGPAGSPCKEITERLEAGDTVILDDVIFTVMSIPGHTLDHIAYYGKGCLFCGDTLFAAGCGRVFEGTMQQMYSSLQQLVALPPDTKIYCGHEYTLANLNFAARVEPQNANIQKRIIAVKAQRACNLPSLPAVLQEELRTNPFLRCEVPAVKAMIEKKMARKGLQPVAVFEALRHWKNSIKF